MNTIFLTEWRERLSSNNISQYRSLANNWMTCATGDRVFKEFGRRSQNYSDDLSKEARKIGNEFTVAVRDCDIKKAQEALEKIESLPSIWAWDYVAPTTDEHDFKDKPKRATASKPKTKRKSKPKKRKPRA